MHAPIEPRLDVREANLGDVRESGAIDAFVRAAAEATPNRGSEA